VQEADMAVTLALKAYVVAVNDPTTNLADLGNYIFGVCIDNGLSTTNPRQIPENDYNYFDDKVDDITRFGGDFWGDGSDSQAASLAILKRYVPLADYVNIDSQYNSNNYAIKLVNKNGWYAISRPLSTVGSADNMFLSLYDNNNNILISNVPFGLSGNVFQMNNPTATWGGIVISKFDDEGKFTTNARYYAVYVQSNRYWGRNVMNTAITSDVAKFQAYVDFLNGIAKDEPIPPTPSDDPYGPGSGGTGYSGGGGGPAGAGGTGATGTGGLHDDTSDTISTPNLPPSIVTGTGLFTAYNPSPTQLANFANELWNADISSIGDLFRLLFGGDAFNAIIGLHLLPVQPDTSGTPNIMLGNWDSGAPAPKISNQYKQVSFGSLMLPEYWGNCIDYSPYTRIQLALPYIGIVDVDTDDVLGSNNTLTYNIDVLSGALCATLHCVKGNLNSVIYQWSGSCSVSLPITGATFNAVMGALAGIGAAAAGTFALASGPIGAAIGAAGSTLVGTGMLAGAAANTFGSAKGKVQKSGAFGANTGALGIMTPYFILTRPVQSVPETWQADKGYPANISAQLGTITGYTEVSEINLECSGTEAEKEEIIKLLKSGVIF
jgi:hypothetical protein